MRLASTAACAVLSLLVGLGLAGCATPDATAADPATSRNRDHAADQVGAAPAGDGPVAAGSGPGASHDRLDGREGGVGGNGGDAGTAFEGQAGCDLEVRAGVSFTMCGVTFAIHGDRLDVTGVQDEGRAMAWSALRLQGNGVHAGASSASGAAGHNATQPLDLGRLHDGKPKPGQSLVLCGGRHGRHLVSLEDTRPIGGFVRTGLDLPSCDAWHYRQAFEVRLTQAVSPLDQGTVTGGPVCLSLPQVQTGFVGHANLTWQAQPTAGAALQAEARAGDVVLSSAYGTSPILLPGLDSGLGEVRITVGLPANGGVAYEQPLKVTFDVMYDRQPDASSLPHAGC